MKTWTPRVVNNPVCFLQQLKLRPTFQIELVSWFIPSAKRRKLRDRASENNRGTSPRRDGDFEITYWWEAPLSNMVIASQDESQSETKIWTILKEFLKGENIIVLRKDSFSPK